MSRFYRDTTFFCKRGTVSLVLSACFIFTQVVGLYAEGGLWGERRAAVERLKTKKTVRSLPEDLSQVAPLPPLGADDLFTDSSRGGVGEQPLPAVPEWVSSLIRPYGAIRNVHISKNPNAPLVIHIQDVHEMEESQINTAGMIEGFTAHEAVALVGLEGAEGSFYFEPYRAWPNTDITKQIAAHFVKKGYLGGTEFAAITLPKSPLVWGVEDQGLYLANIKALQDAEKVKSLAHQWLNGLAAQAERLKATIYSQSLMEFDKHEEAYNEGREALGDFGAALFSLAPAPWKAASPNLSVFLSARTAEKTIDIKRVQEEREELMATLLKTLSPSELNTLAQKSLNHRMGRQRGGAYYRELKNLCRTQGVSLASLAQFNAYVEYVLLCDAIDLNGLLREVDALRTSVPLALAATSEQEKLVISVHQLALLKKLINHQMNPAEWSDYTLHKDDIRDIGTKFFSLSTSSPPRSGEETSFPSLAPFENFCRFAQKRNSPMATRLIKKMKRENVHTALLVAGGFHTEGLLSVLQRNGISTIVITPHMGNVPKEIQSLDVFTRPPSVLEQFFMWDKISLASWRLTASETPRSERAASRAAALETTYALFQLMAQTLTGEGQAKSYTRLCWNFRSIGKNGFFFRSQALKRGIGSIMVDINGGIKQLLGTIVSSDHGAAQQERDRLLPKSFFDRLILNINGGAYDLRVDDAADLRWEGRMKALLALGISVGVVALVYSALPFPDIIQGLAGEPLLALGGGLIIKHDTSSTHINISPFALKRLIISSLEAEEAYLQAHGRTVDLSPYKDGIEGIIGRLAEEKKLLYKDGESYMVYRQIRGDPIDFQTDVLSEEYSLFQALSPVFQKQCKSLVFKQDNRTGFPSIYPATRAFASVLDWLRKLPPEDRLNKILPVAIGTISNSNGGDPRESTFEDFVKTLKSILREFRRRKEKRMADTSDGEPESPNDWMATLNNSAPLFDLETARLWLKSTPRSELVDRDGNVNLSFLNKILEKLDQTIVRVYFSDDPVRYLLEYMKILRAIVQQPSFSLVKTRKNIGVFPEVEVVKNPWVEKDGMDQEHLFRYGNNWVSLLTTFPLSLPGNPKPYRHVRSSRLASPEGQEWMVELLGNSSSSETTGAAASLPPPAKEPKEKVVLKNPDVEEALARFLTVLVGNRPRPPALRAYNEFNMVLGEQKAKWSGVKMDPARAAELRTAVGIALGAVPGGRSYFALLADAHADEGKAPLYQSAWGKDIFDQAISSRKERHKAEVLFLATLVEGATEMALQEGIEEYNERMKIHFKLDSSEGKVEQAVAKVGTKCGVAFETSAGMRDPSAELTGQETTALKAFLKLVAHCAALPEKGQLKVMVVLQNFEGRLQTSDDEDRALESLATRAAELSGQNVDDVLDQLGAIRETLWVRTLAKDQTIDVKKEMGVESADVFALDAAHWEWPGPESAVRLLVFLAGDLVKDAAGRINKKFRALNLIRLAA